MSLNLGFNKTRIVKQFDIMDMLNAEDEMHLSMIEAKAALDDFKNFLTVVETIKKHGSYSGFESLITDRDQLNYIIGCDICNADSASIEAIESSEILRDSINRFLTKVSTLIGRVGDRVANFIKTTLPFKEKYLKEMTELKERMRGKSFDEEKFQSRSVASALTKEKFNRLTTERKKIFNTLMTVCHKASEINMEAFLTANNDVSDVLRTSLGSVAWRPYLSWFHTAKVRDLGFKTSDVSGVLDHAIDEIRSIIELHTWSIKASDQYQRLNDEISQLRATGKVDEAIEKRGEASRLAEFFFQLWEAAEMYEALVRREMYFATYLGRALMQSQK